MQRDTKIQHYQVGEVNNFAEIGKCIFLITEKTLSTFITARSLL